MTAKQKIVRMLVEVSVPEHVSDDEAISQVRQGTQRELARVGVRNPRVAVASADQLTSDLADITARVIGLSKVVADL